jgi:hypothetical protein
LSERTLFLLLLFRRCGSVAAGRSTAGTRGRGSSSAAT